MMEPATSEQETDIFEGQFGFREAPFGVTPDPRFFHGSPVYLEGLRALGYGIHGKRGLILLTGEIGTGKTILLRKLMRQLQPAVQFVFVSSSHLTSYGLVELTLKELGLSTNNKDKNRLDMLHDLKQYLIAQLKTGRIVALLIDEAQNLSDEALEGLCGLSNLETDEAKLLQIVLVGQPELANKLNKSSQRRLKQRIAVHYRLHSLQTIAEANDYIAHRIKVAGYEGPDLFNKEAIEAVWYYSARTPRFINIICDNALTMAWEASKKRVSAYMVMRAAATLLLDAGMENSKISAADVGVPRLRSPAARTGQKRAESAGIESRSAKGLENLSIPIRDTELQSISPPAAQTLTVSAAFLEQLARAATEAMGPMAHVVLREQIFALGESREAFPERKVKELIELMSREILNETMRARFKEALVAGVAAPKT
jgi:general secretion pathway protein A